MSLVYDRSLELFHLATETIPIEQLLPSSSPQFLVTPVCKSVTTLNKLIEVGKFSI